MKTNAILIKRPGHVPALIDDAGRVRHVGTEIECIKRANQAGLKLVNLTSLKAQIILNIAGLTLAA